MPNCKIHPDRKLVCLACLGAKGGKRTAKVHGDKVGEWAERGRRARRRNKKAAEDPAAS